MIAPKQLPALEGYGNGWIQGKQQVAMELRIGLSSCCQQRVKSGSSATWVEGNQ
jgi:hypothetical protein